MTCLSPKHELSMWLIRLAYCPYSWMFRCSSSCSWLPGGYANRISPNPTTFSIELSTTSMAGKFKLPHPARQTSPVAITQRTAPTINPTIILWETFTGSFDWIGRVFFHLKGSGELVVDKWSLLGQGDKLLLQAYAHRAHSAHGWWNLASGAVRLPLWRPVIGTKLGR